MQTIIKQLEKKGYYSNVHGSNPDAIQLIQKYESYNRIRERVHRYAFNDALTMLVNNRTEFDYYVDGDYRQFSPTDGLIWFNRQMKKYNIKEETIDYLTYLKKVLLKLASITDADIANDNALLVQERANAGLDANGYVMMNPDALVNLIQRINNQIKKE